MSNPPFGSPLYVEEEDFSFPFDQAPNDPSTSTSNPLLLHGINPDPLPSTSIPMSDFRDLSLFLDQDEDFPLIGQLPTPQEIPDEWVKEIEQVFDDDLLDSNNQVQQGAQASSDGDGVNQHRPIDHDHDHDHQQQAQAGVGEGSSIKKLDHNAKERVRRLKLNTSYLALRSLLPESKKAKEKWSAPYIIDRALDYIPQLQAEIERLTLDKTSILSAIGNQKQQEVDDNQVAVVPKDEQTVTVSMNEVKKGQVIIQTCQKREKLDEFSSLIGRLEEEDMQVIGASSSHVSEERSCFHLHVQMGEKTALEADYVADLHKKLISWLS